jgi:hypothetical protein
LPEVTHGIAERARGAELDRHAAASSYSVDEAAQQVATVHL